MNAEKIGTSTLGIHLGNAVSTLAARYPKLTDVGYEYVQNALDSGSTSIVVKVDYNKREMRILDNGEGTDKIRFEEALSLVCQSRKTESKGSLGQFGIGLISALGKCESYTFTSTPKNDSFGYRQWNFVTADLLSQEKQLNIPNRKIDNLGYLIDDKRRGIEKVVWRTEIFLHNITNDKTISKISGPDFRDGIIARFGEKMRQLETTIRIMIIGPKKERYEEEFTAPQYSGDKIDLIKYQEKDRVLTRFDLYQALKDQKGKRNGKIGFGIKGDPYRVAGETFLQTHHQLISPDIQALLLSGLFEGNIISSDCRLAVERNGFVENDELIKLCEHLERWYKEFGKDFELEIMESQQDERRHATGIKSLKTIEKLLKNEKFSPLMDILKDIKKGSIGPNHTDFSSAKGEREEVRSLTTRAGEKKMKKVSLEDLKNLKGTDTPPTNGGASTPPPAAKAKEPRGHYENLQHNTVNGTKRGSRRKIVQGASTGLRLEYDEMSGQAVIWDYNRLSGTLRFNIRHRLWAQAEKRERSLTKFQEQIIIQALTVETFPPQMRKDLKEFAEKQVEYQLGLIEAEYGYAKK